jgi:hypothetical protein
MIYHYTCKFKDYQMPMHGEIDFPRATAEDTKGNENVIVNKIRAKLVDDCVKWGFSPKDMILFECYFFDKGKEKPIFRWQLNK